LNSKIIGILVCILLFFSFLPMAYSEPIANYKYLKYKSNEKIRINNHIQVQGYVKNTNNDPYYYASVRLEVCYTNGSHSAGTLTNESGYFYIFLPEHLLYKTGILTASILDINESVEIEITENILPIELILPVIEIPNSTICGYIKDLSMKPIENTIVSENIRYISETTDEDGYYQINDVTPGKLIFTFQEPHGYKNYGSVHTGIIPGELKKWYNFTFLTSGNLPGGINGTLTDFNTGELIVNAKIMIFVNGEILTKYTDESGYYEFSNIPPNDIFDEYLLLGAKNGYQALYESIEVSSNVTTLSNHQLKNNSIYTCMMGFLYDNEGNKIKEGTFELSTENGYQRSSFWRGGYRSGHFYLSPWPDSFHVKFTSEGYNVLEDDISLPNPGIYVKHYTLTKIWMKKTDSLTIDGFAGKEYENNHTIITQNGSIITDVEVFLNWEDDNTYGIFKNKGLDNLSLMINQSGNLFIDSSEGYGNLTNLFEINDMPINEIEPLAKNQVDFNIQIHVKTGEKIWRLLNYIKDKGNDFTITFQYTYYVRTN